MDGQANPNGQQPAHRPELPHDEPVSLRQPADQPPLPSPVQPATQPYQLPPQPAGPITNEPIQPVATAPAIQPAGQPFFDQPADDVDLLPADYELSWTASEFIDHPKTAKWYLALGGISLSLLVLAFFITRGDIITLIILLITFGLFGYMASRRPRQLSYALNSDGLLVGMKLYRYEDFRAFSLFQEGHFASINFTPLKRFAPSLSVYFDPDQADQVADILSRHLPYGQHQPTLVDNLMHRIRF